MVELIEETYSWANTGLTSIGHDETVELQQLLLGHSVKKIADDHLELDDGTVLRIVPNQGGCSCDSGEGIIPLLERGCYDAT